MIVVRTIWLQAKELSAGERLGDFREAPGTTNGQNRQPTPQPPAPIRLEAQKVDIGRPYYIAKTALNALKNHPRATARRVVRVAKAIRWLRSIQS